MNRWQYDARQAGMGLAVNFNYNVPTADVSFYTSNRAWKVAKIIGRIDTAGTDGSAVTAVIRKVPSGTAGTSGTALHSSSFDLKGTVNTNQTLTLSTTVAATTLTPGDSLFFDLTGTATAAVGSITVHLVPA